MSVRVEAGSDIARLGVWDVTAPPLPRDTGKLREQAVQDAIAKAELFVIETGADGNDTIDVFVNETPAVAQLQGFRQVGEERLLHVSSGTARVDGLEYYRSGDPSAQPADVFAAAPGAYGITCWRNTEDEISGEEGAQESFRAAIGEADYAHYRKAERGTYLGCWTILLFPLLTPVLGWKVSLAIAVAVVIAWTHVREWWLKRDARYQAILSQRTEHWKRAAAASPATMILVLRSLSGTEGLQGGMVRVER